MTNDELLARLRYEIDRYEGAEPLFVLTIFLARCIDPETCGDIDPRVMNMKTEPKGRRREVVEFSGMMICALCAVVESEYAQWITDLGKSGRA